MRLPVVSGCPLKVLPEVCQAVPRVQRDPTHRGCEQTGLSQHAAGFYSRREAVPAKVVGEVAPVGGVEDANVGFIAGRQATDIIKTEHLGGVYSTRPQRLSGGEREAGTGEVHYQRQRLAEGASGIEVRGEGDDGPLLDEQAGGRGRSRNSPQAGSRTAATSLLARRCAPSSPVFSRWSTLRAPSSMARGIAPRSENWSACSLRARPWLAQASRYLFASGTSKEPRSRKMSAARASGVASGRTAWITKSTYSAAPENSGGTVCAPRKVGWTSTGWPSAAHRMARRDFSSVSRSRP